MTNHTMGTNSQRPLHFTNNETDLLRLIGGDPLAGSGFESEDPNRGFAVTELVGPERDTPEKE